MNTFELAYTDNNETVEKVFEYTIEDIIEAHREVGWLL